MTMSLMYFISHSSMFMLNRLLYLPQFRRINYSNALNIEMKKLRGILSMVALYRTIFITKEVRISQQQSESKTNRVFD